MDEEVLDIFKMVNGFEPNEREAKLFDKVSEISSSEFPLIDFLNDIFKRKFDKDFFYATALNDIEKIADYVILLESKAYKE